MGIVCWRLNEKRDYDDDVNDVHICVDCYDLDDLVDHLLNRKIINGKPLRNGANQLKLNCDDFPDKNPKHVEVGYESFNEGYKSSIKIYKSITFEVCDDEDEIQIHEFEDEECLVVQLSNRNLELITAGLNTSKTFTYVYDNFLPIKLVQNGREIEAKLIIWAGKEGNILYR